MTFPEAYETEFRRFYVHYDIQHLVHRHPNGPFRSKTIVVEMEDIDVEFAAKELMNLGKDDSVYVRVQIGVTTVTPHVTNPNTGKKRKQMYSRSEGRTEALKRMKPVNLKISSVTIADGESKVTLDYPEEEIVLSYVKRKGCRSRLYLTYLKGLPMLKR